MLHYALALTKEFICLCSLLYVLSVSSVNNTLVSAENEPQMEKNAAFWDVAPCRSSVNRRFGEAYRIHLQGRKSESEEPA
jgi:hypothetical protein